MKQIKNFYFALILLFMLSCAHENMTTPSNGDEQDNGNANPHLTEEQQAERKYFYEQVSKVPQALTSKDIPAVALEKIETDDVIAWLCKLLHDKLEEIIIVSSDKDLCTG